MQNYISNAIIGVSLIVAALLLRPAGTANLPVPQFELVSSQNYVFRINKVNGRTDFLLPGPNGVLLIPIFQMNPTSEDVSKLSDEEREKWQNVSKMMSAYLNGAKVNFTAAPAPAASPSSAGTTPSAPAASGSPAPAASSSPSVPKFT